MRWCWRFPSGTCQSFRGTGTRNADAVDFLNFGAFEKPRQPDINQSGAEDHGDKYHELNKKGRVEGEVGVMIRDQAAGAHDQAANGDFAQGAQNREAAERAIAEAEDREQYDEGTQRGDGGRERRATILKTPVQVKGLKEHDVEQNIQEERDEGDDHRRLGVFGGIEGGDNQLHTG